MVIPKEVRKKLNNLKPGTKVSVQTNGGDTLIIKTDPKNWVEQTRGLMRDEWKNRDPIKDLEKMRDEW